MQRYPDLYLFSNIIIPAYAIGRAFLFISSNLLHVDNK